MSISKTNNQITLPGREPEYTFWPQPKFASGYANFMFFILKSSTATPAYFRKLSLCIHSRVTVPIQKNVFLADTASGPLTCKFKALSKRNTLEGNIHNTHDLYNQVSGASLNLKALQIWSYLCSNSDFGVP